MKQTSGRKDQRQGLVMRASFRSLAREAIVIVSNLSINGCRIELERHCLQEANRVKLKPEGFESFLGTVRWSTMDSAGIEFDRPLHPAIVDHLCRQHLMKN